MRAFWEKYFNLITKSSYSTIFFDIYKGVEALDNLVQFVIININGVKINQIFGDYKQVSLYLQKTYKLSEDDVDAIGESRIFTNPQKLYDFYVQSRDTYCSPKKLKYFIKTENAAYVQVLDEGINNFWETLSSFMCSSSSPVFSSLIQTMGSSFALPSGVKDVRFKDSLLVEFFQIDSFYVASFL